MVVTVTLAATVCPSDVAVMVGSLPTAAAVTSPPPETVAAPLLDDHA